VIPGTSACILETIVLSISSGISFVPGVIAVPVLKLIVLNGRMTIDLFHAFSNPTGIEATGV
jgi:hypothetical protein